MKLQTEKGEITISSEVFTHITGAAATNCYGVKGMAIRSATDGWSTCCGGSPWPRASR